MNANVLKPIDATYSSIVIGNLYGGNNLGGTAGNCFINIDEGDIGSLYGGGNEALVNSTNVDIDNAYFNVIYGGGNAAGVNTSMYFAISSLHSFVPPRNSPYAYILFTYYIFHYFFFLL